MLRKIGFTSLLAASVLFCNASSAEVNHALSANSVVEYELPANDPQVFSNPMFWSITATCTLHMTNTSNMFIEGLNKTGKINGVTLKKGDTLTMEIHDNDQLEIVADSAAKVQLTNLGDDLIKATCRT